MQHNVRCHSQVCNQETEGVEGPVNQCNRHWWIWDFFYNLTDLDMASTSTNKSVWSGILCLCLCFYNVAVDQNVWAVTTRGFSTKPARVRKLHCSSGCQHSCINSSSTVLVSFHLLVAQHKEGSPGLPFLGSKHLHCFPFRTSDK